MRTFCLDSLQRKNSRRNSPRLDWNEKRQRKFTEFRAVSASSSLFAQTSSFVRVHSIFCEPTRKKAELKEQISGISKRMHPPEQLRILRPFHSLTRYSHNVTAGADGSGFEKKRANIFPKLKNSSREMNINLDDSSENRSI